MPRARNPSLWVLFGLQLFCAVFFVLDAVLDFLGVEMSSGMRDVDTFEYFVAFALFCGVIMTGYQIRRAERQAARLARQVAAVSDDFAVLLDQQFDAWNLTRSERDVALLAMKGLSVSEIAEARGTAEGTVKAHSSAVYRKAGVTGRMQLLSYFVDELLAGVGGEGATNGALSGSGDS